MRAHYLQHVPFEGLGSIESWLQNAGYEITTTKFFESGGLPEIEGVTATARAVACYAGLTRFRLVCIVMGFTLL
jgi:hypothetical protein